MLRSWKAFGVLVGVTIGLALVFVGPGPNGVTPAFAAGGAVTFTVIDTDNPNGGTNIDFTSSGAATCSPGSFSLDESQSQVLTCTANGALTITLGGGEPWTIDGTTGCILTDAGPTLGQQSSSPTDNSTTVSFTTLTDDEKWTCSVRLNGTGASPTATPTVTGTPATATPTVTTTPQVTSVTVSVAPSTLGCNGSAFVTVVSRNAAGALVPGGAVTLQTTLGTISPTSATDTGGGVLAVLTAPQNQGGTATIKATAGGISGQATATINCAQATNTPIPPTQAPPAAIVPPSTGDGGLAERSQASTFAGLVLLGMAFAGAAGIVWSKVRS